MATLHFCGPDEAFAAWLDQMDVFLLDCDGVLWRGPDKVPGVDETVAALRAAGKRVYFVSNNSTKARGDFVSKMTKVTGIPCEGGDFLTSAFAAASYAKAQGLRRAYVVGEAGLHAELREVAGMTTLGLEDGAVRFAFGGLSLADLDPDVDCVVIGFDGAFSYTKLAKASAYLTQAGRPVRFIATNRDATYPDAGITVPGGGSLVAALVTAAGREPDVVAGKPSASLLDLVQAATGLDRARTCMVGDRLDTDILFGNGGGLGSTLLVYTGVTTPEVVAALPEGAPARPTHSVDTFGLMGPWIRAVVSARGGAASAGGAAAAPSE